MLKHYVSINGPGKDSYSRSAKVAHYIRKVLKTARHQVSQTMNEKEPFFNSMTRYWPRTKRGTMEDAISILKVLESDTGFRPNDAASCGLCSAPLILPTSSSQRHKSICFTPKCGCPTVICSLSIRSSQVLGACAAARLQSEVVVVSSSTHRPGLGHAQARVRLMSGI